MKKLIVLLMSFVFLTIHAIECATFINCTEHSILVIRGKKKQRVKNSMVGDLGGKGRVELKIVKGRTEICSLSYNVSTLDKKIYCLDYDKQQNKLFFTDLALRVKD